jgi:hypothetical protein
MAAKVDALHENQPEIFNRLGKNERDIVAIQTTCKGVQDAKAARSGIVTAIFIIVISSAIIACTGAAFTMYEHAKQSAPVSR